MAVKRGKYKKTVFIIKKKGCAGKEIKVQYKYKGTDSSEIFVLEENMNKLLAKLTAALMLFSLCSCSTAEETDKPIGSNAVYDVLGMGKIPVGMWVTPPDGYRTEDAFRLISESGINVVNGFGYSEDTDEEVKTVLDCCQKYGLKYLYSSLSIEESIKSYKENPDAELISSAMEQIDKFAGHPAYAGQLFIDEPSVSYFDTLKEYITEYKKRHSDKLCYVNMLPYYALAGTGSSRYEDYVDTWIDKTSPAFYSYDSYPLIDYDPTQEGYRAEMEDFYYNLDLLRAKTLENGIPLWTFVATLGYQHASEPNRREPTREELRWQVFSNLAFGAKGLQYFCYWTPSQDSYGEAMVTRGGKPTERYDYVKEVNAEFASYGDLLLNSDAVGVMINDYRRDGYDIYSTPLTKFGKIESVEGNRYVIGCFSDKDTGKKSVLISPTTPRDDVEITLNMSGKTKSVTAYIGGEKTTLEVKDNKLTLKIDRGDAVFIQL